MRNSIFITAVLAALVCAACNGQAPQWANDLFGDPPVKPAQHISILCDHSSGSTCNEAELTANIDAALTTVADRPQSTVALFALGTDLATTRELGRITVPALANRRERAQRAAQRHFIETARAELLRDAQSIFTTPPLRTSPLAEALTKIAYTRAVPHHTIIVISDGLEYAKTTFDFECKKIPSPEAFVARLQHLALFTPGSMRDTRIVFVNQRLGTIDDNRCPQTMARIAAVRTAWAAAAHAAGATATFSSDTFGGI